VHPIADLQIEYSLISRGIESEILPVARELGIGITAYGVLSRGLISGHWSADRPLAAGDFRGVSPRFSGDNLGTNLALVEALRAVADAGGVSVAQVAIAWVLAQGNDIAPIPGTKRVSRLEENVAADAVELTAEQVKKLTDLPAAAGDHHAEAQMRLLDR
jgi:aryl-alcohol dehydrogenase-like predicted oxidoreductase